jgi:hypothetical protein
VHRPGPRHVFQGGPGSSCRLLPGSRNLRLTPGVGLRLKLASRCRHLWHGWPAVHGLQASLGRLHQTS